MQAQLLALLEKMLHASGEGAGMEGVERAGADSSDDESDGEGGAAARGAAPLEEALQLVAGLLSLQGFVGTVSHLLARDSDRLRLRAVSYLGDKLALLDASLPQVCIRPPPPAHAPSTPPLRLKARSSFARTAGAPGAPPLVAAAARAPAPPGRALLSPRAPGAPPPLPPVQSGHVSSIPPY